MEKQDRLFIIGMVSVIIGNLLGFLLAAGIVVADFEGSLFLFGLEGEKNARRLDCPALMTTNETREIRLILNNPSEREITRFVVATITEGSLTLNRRIKQNVPVDPGEKKEITWEIYPEDAAYGGIILFKVYVKRDYPYPSLNGDCGVLVLDIPLLTGNQVTGILLGLISTLLLGGNAVLQFQYRNAILGPRRQNMSRAMFIMSLLVLLDILFSFLGTWVFGLILLIWILLMIVILILQIAL